MDRDTVTALSTPKGRGGIAVIRLSGGNTLRILNDIIERFPDNPEHSKAVHSFVTAGGKRIEECVVTFFRSPSSYTGEDVAEISIHSNPFLTERVLDLIVKKGARPALPGEFTYRAFKNGKMDLIQAESVNELINANSRYFAEMKFGSLEGKLSEFLNDIKKNLMGMGIKIETILEFQEDHRIDEIDLSGKLEDTLNNIGRLIDNYRMNEIMNRGIKIVIVGKVNVGKSSLFNRILLEDRSITSAEPGTTRDFIREKVYLNGFLAEITDVAGINNSSDNGVEKQGIVRGLDQIKNADIVVFMLDAVSGIDSNDTGLYELIKDKEHITVLNKTDAEKSCSTDDVSEKFPLEQIIPVSVLKNINLESIYEYFNRVLEQFKGDEMSVAVNLRQKNILTDLQETLKVIIDGIRSGISELELVAEEIRKALFLIGKLLGEVTEEDILHGIFSSFCVGK